MTRRPPALRPTVVALLGLGVAVVITGCFSPAPVPTATVEPTDPALGGIGQTAEPIETGEPVEDFTPDTGYAGIVDDLGVLAIQVPEDWTETDTRPYVDDIDQQWASIAASPDLNAYATSWTVSGVEAGAAPVSDVIDAGSLRTFLDSVAAIYAECDVLEEGVDYSDPVYAGYSSFYENCGGTDTEGFAIVAINADGTHVIYVRSQIAGDDDPAEIFDHLADTFTSTI